MYMYMYIYIYMPHNNRRQLCVFACVRVCIHAPVCTCTSFAVRDGAQLDLVRAC